MTRTLPSVPVSVIGAIASVITPAMQPIALPGTSLAVVLHDSVVRRP
ncbi:hypothetical protein ABQZ99_003580 [Xanthomonas hortorum pv. vitians]|uniref:Uncharacterized protein n=1 Tax=Xanthomonas hortorum pv. vitians TaxID=83224 RepID=A0AAW8ZY51_9XANT|nr:hypothetical protein [Xanthomonas hortorum]MCC4626380.1 hypothetical protein [Xanthomonas campestris pv. nigromaculans]MCC8556061.1 hypothetical protein [Xanthomonas hortorum pv. gardneri]MCC8658440.1 hypothetical protein [Xanthomonas hortorum pv. gardneri]MCC8725115.1 hypothetical protein [Xanthomonas hortorum pv. gardneri]MCE4282507.1 hypothetical protein [Xanthomonas hortorum pv. vitians]